MKLRDARKFAETLNANHFEHIVKPDAMSSAIQACLAL